LFFDYKRQYNLDIKVVRIFNTYGPRMSPNDGRVVSNLIVQALKNAEISIYGDGRQTRSFCYVDDTVEALIKIMELPKSLCGPINVGNPVEMSVLQLAQAVVSLCRSNSLLSFRPLPSDDPRQRRPNIDLIKSLAHWQPHTALEDGLQKTIAYFRQENLI